jgi:hypothetical protein
MKKKYKILLIFGLIIGLFFSVVSILSTINRKRLYRKLAMDSIATVIYDHRVDSCELIMCRENIRINNLKGKYKFSLDYDGIYYANEFSISHYGVQVGWDTTTNDPKRIMMDSAIFARYGRNFYKMIERKGDSIEKARKKVGGFLHLDGSQQDTKEGLTYNIKDKEKLSAYILRELHRAFPHTLMQPPCHPLCLWINILIRKDGTTGCVWFIDRLTPEINNKVVELIEHYPYKWTPGILNGKPVDFRVTMFYMFGEYPYPRRRE